MLDIRTYSEGLCKKDGIYFSKKIKKSVISYPEEGHNRCLKIEDNSFWFRHRNSCIILGIKRYYANKIIFDVGGGTGSSLKRYKMKILLPYWLSREFRGA